MIKNFCKSRNVVLYCDFHGHAKKRNVFIYGCENKFLDYQNIDNLSSKNNENSGKSVNKLKNNLNLSNMNLNNKIVKLLSSNVLPFPTPLHYISSDDCFLKGNLSSLNSSTSSYYSISSIISSISSSQFENVFIPPFFKIPSYFPLSLTSQPQSNFNTLNFNSNIPTPYLTSSYLPSIHSSNPILSYLARPSVPLPYHHPYFHPLFLQEQIFPYLLSIKSPIFCFNDSDIKIRKNKEGSGRQTVCSYLFIYLYMCYLYYILVIK
jgi:hypothetical protein